VLQRSEQQSVSAVHIEPEATHAVAGAVESPPASDAEIPTHLLFSQTLPIAQSSSIWHAVVSELQPACEDAVTATKTRAASETDAIRAYLTSLIVAFILDHAASKSL